MLTRLIHYWEKIRSSYWLLPGMMLLGTVLLALGLSALDRHLDFHNYQNLKWLVFASADGARLVLSTVAVSTFSAATLSFSVTMVTLNLTSSQFGPRLLRNFLRDTVNQFIFGAFIATFIYCLLVLRGMGIDGHRIPNLSVAFSIILVLIDAALFIWFIHHVTSSIQIDHITNDIGTELLEAISRYFPEAYEKKELKKSLHQHFEYPSVHIRNNQRGYIQAINYEKLIDLAKTHKITVKINYKPGNYLLPGVSIAEINSENAMEPDLEKQILDTIYLGIVPTSEQDVEYSIRQLVQVAARALSPGINDPFTAMACIDYLGAGLAILATRQIPPAEIIDENGRLLLIRKIFTFSNLCDASFRIIRQMCRNNTPVAIYLLDTLAQLAEVVLRYDDRQVVLEIAKLTADAAINEGVMPHDRNIIQKRFEAVDKNLKKRT